MKSDSNDRLPAPSGDRKPGKKPATVPDQSDAIGFRHREPSDEPVSGSPGDSGPRSGSSIITWNELVRKQTPEDDIGIGKSEPFVEFDAESDQDLLLEVLAGEKPPSEIIMKDPSAHEIKVTPLAPADDQSDNALGGLEEVFIPLPVDLSSRKMPNPTRTVSEASFELPPEIEAEARRSMAASGRYPRVTPVDDDDDATFFANPNAESDDNSSILSALSAGPASGLLPGQLSEGSRVDLLGHLRKPDDSGSSSARTEDMDPRSRGFHPASIKDDDDESLLLGGQMGDDDDDESSAVDLGARPVVEMPFPNGADSSSAGSPARAARSASSRSGRDSASVDLAGGVHEFHPDRFPGSSVDPNQFSGHDADLPPTVPIGAQPSTGRAIAWTGGATLGMLAGVAASAGLWYADMVPLAKSDVGKPVNIASLKGPVVPANDVATQQALDKAQERATAFENEFKLLNARLRKAGLDGAKLDEFTQKLAASDAAAKQAQTKYDEAVAKLNDVQRAADESKDAKAQLDKLNEQLKKLKVDPATLPATLQKLVEGRRNAEAAVQTAQAKLQELRDQAEQASVRAKDAEDRAASAAAVGAPHKEFAKIASQKLVAAGLVAVAAKPEELLAALDKALSKSGGAPIVANRPSPESAAKLFAAGLRAYRTGDLTNSETALVAAIRADDRDARPRYVLALIRKQTGRSEQAEADFRAAADLERQYQPPPHDIDDLLARFSVQDRAVLSQHRP